jgi:hypothetical protein
MLISMGVTYYIPKQIDNEGEDTDNWNFYVFLVSWSVNLLERVANLLLHNTNNLLRTLSVKRRHWKFNISGLQETNSELRKHTLTQR